MKIIRSNLINRNGARYKTASSVMIKTFLSQIGKMKQPAWIALSALLVIGGVACRKPSAGKPADVDYYTCTMHPSVRKQSPTDKCPICSMDLVPVMKRGDNTTAVRPEHSGHAEHREGPPPQTGASTNEDKPGAVSVPVERQQQIGVTYATIE